MQARLGLKVKDFFHGALPLSRLRGEADSPSGLAFGKPKDRLRAIRDCFPRVPLRSMRATVSAIF